MRILALALLAAAASAPLQTAAAQRPTPAPEAVEQRPDRGERGARAPQQRELLEAIRRIVREEVRAALREQRRGRAPETRGNRVRIERDVVMPGHPLRRIRILEQRAAERGERASPPALRDAPRSEGHGSDHHGEGDHGDRGTDGNRRTERVSEDRQQLEETRQRLMELRTRLEAMAADQHRIRERSRPDEPERQAERRASTQQRLEQVRKSLDEMRQSLRELEQRLRDETSEPDQGETTPVRVRRLR